MVGRSEYFRLLDLPQELRDRIYELTLEARAFFHHAQRSKVDPSYQQPRGLATQRDSQEKIGKTRVKNGYSREQFIEWNVSRWFHYDVREEPDPDRYISITCPYLVFKVNAVTTPLLLVSTAIYAEVKDYLKLHKTRFIHECNDEIASAIFAGDTIVSPSPFFREIWERSSLIFGYSTTTALRFMLNLPVELAEELQTVVFAGGLIKAISFTVPGGLIGDGWNVETGKERSLFGTWLVKLLPKLKSVALWLPVEITDTELYNESVPIQICDMLRSGRLDVVRFYYTSISESITTDRYFLAGSDLPELRPTLYLDSMSEEYQRWREIDAEFEDDQDCRKKIRVHDLDVVEEVVDENLDNVWKLLNAKRVVKLTRRAENDTSTAN